MRPIHEHEIRHVVERHVNSRRDAPAWPRVGRLLLDLLPLPVLFAGLCLAWPVLTGMPVPWWALAGLALYSGLAGTALVVALQGKE
jgi:hypothetical protein